jgi:Tetratricopeptide repeat
MDGGRYLVSAAIPNAGDKLSFDQQGQQVGIQTNIGKVEVKFVGLDGRTAPEPVLVWRELPEDRNEITRLLTWQTQLCDGLIGRERELDALLAWARHGRGPRLRVLSGPGGAGKTRLAAEVAQRLMDEDWTAGFADRADTSFGRSDDKPCFVILDYPEEQREGLRAIIKGLARLAESATPVRVLLLSRQPAEAWQAEVSAAHADAIFDGLEIRIEPLTNEQAMVVFASIRERLRDRYGLQLLPLAPDAVASWIDRDRSLHALPLFTTAAAVHSALENAGSLTLGGGKIIQALARREVKRLDNAGRQLGLGDEGGSRLAALAAARGGIDAQALERLAEPALGILPRMMTGDDIVDQVRKMPNWTGDRVPAPQPDIVAATMLVSALGKRPDRAPEWLWATLEGSAPALTDRLARLVYDARTVFGGEARAEQPGSALARWLADMVSGKPARAHALAFIEAEDHLPVGLAPLAVAISQTLIAGCADPEDRAGLLSNCSVHLAQCGDGAGALAAIREAMETYRRLAAENPARLAPDLALSLNNLSLRLSDAGDGAGALAAIREAVEIGRRLAAENPARFAPDLALSLNNLSLRLSDAGDGPGALAAIREAVEIRRRLAAENPARFAPKLTNSLNILSRLEGTT